MQPQTRRSSRERSRKNGRDGGDDKPDTLSERDQFSRDAMVGREH